MNKAEYNNIWDSFTDKLNRERFITEGVAFLERWYEKDGDRIRHHHKNTEDDATVIPLPLVAKGISAYLSYWPYSDDKSLRILLYENNSINTDEIFTRYFENCYKFLDYSNRKIALPHKRKSKADLILEHLKIEEQYLIESEPLFFECKPWEKDTIAEIKEVALFYPVWVKKTYLKLDVQDTTNESINTSDDSIIPMKSCRHELTLPMISFNKVETIDLIFNELKGYFPGFESEFRKTLSGKRLVTPILFIGNQSKLVEVFRRLRYNNFLINTPTEIRNWICSNFNFRYKNGNHEELRPFNESTVWDVLTKEKNELTKRGRICVVDWLPYKSYNQLKNEK